jgi:hypothetical protein
VPIPPDGGAGDRGGGAEGALCAALVTFITVHSESAEQPSAHGRRSATVVATNSLAIALDFLENEGIDAARAPPRGFLEQPSGGVILAGATLLAKDGGPRCASGRPPTLGPPWD